MVYTYTSTNRFFIETPYLLEPKTTKTPFNSQQLLDYISNTNREQFEIDGTIIIAEYTIDGKYKYPIIAFPHDIWTPTGKIQKYFKKALENKSFTDDYTPTNLWEQPYDKQIEKM